MYFVANVQDLNDSLNNVTKALAARATNQIQEGVLIETIENGVILTCTDGKLSIQSTIVANVQEHGSIVLPGKLLTELVRKLPLGNVTMQTQSNRQTSIICGNSRSNISGMNPIDFPEMNEIIPNFSVKISQAKLKRMVSKVTFAIAVEDPRLVLTGCLLEVSENYVKVVALDGYRMAIQELDQKFQVPENSVYKAVIPGRVMNELSKILTDDDAECELLFDKKNLRVIFGNNVMTTVLLVGDYVDYVKITPKNFKSSVKVNKANLQEAIDRVSLVARESKSNLITFQISSNVMNISANSSLGDMNEDLNISLNGDPITISFNYKYLNDAIRNIDDEIIFMNFSSNVSPCVIVKEDRKDYLYLILPVRIA
ncbi:MAG: DNA polymerase III subunit beta [Clostridia bacterium]|nr:DNA polymerase III subunit beta [Clostridia bacterium]